MLYALPEVNSVLVDKSVWVSSVLNVIGAEAGELISLYRIRYKSITFRHEKSLTNMLPVNVLLSEEHTKLLS